MISSMTGFARFATESAGQSLVWEIRSVNHRYLDLRIQIPDNLRALEGDVRTELQRSLARGRVDAQLRLERREAESGIRFNTERARELIRTIGEIDHMMVNGARVSALEILSWPGVFLPEAVPDADALHDAAIAALHGAIAALQDMRRTEGETLRQTLVTRLVAFSALVAAVRTRRTEVIEEQRERLRSRIAELDLTLEPQRLEQEIALLAQRLDVDEELDRLDGHITAMREILDRPDPVGRRLDFLMQEFNREANTVGSKSHDLATTQAAMEMKLLTEQMREQIQNIE